MNRSSHSSESPICDTCHISVGMLNSEWILKRGRSIRRFQNWFAQKYGPFLTLGISETGLENFENAQDRMCSIAGKSYLRGNPQHPAFHYCPTHPRPHFRCGSCSHPCGVLGDRGHSTELGSSRPECQSRRALGIAWLVPRVDRVAEQYDDRGNHTQDLRCERGIQFPRRSSRGFCRR